MVQEGEVQSGVCIMARKGKRVGEKKFKVPPQRLCDGAPRTIFVGKFALIDYLEEKVRYHIQFRFANYATLAVGWGSCGR